MPRSRLTSGNFCFSFRSLAAASTPLRETSGVGFQREAASRPREERERKGDLGEMAAAFLAAIFCNLISLSAPIASFLPSLLYRIVPTFNRSCLFHRLTYHPFSPFAARARKFTWGNNALGKRVRAERCRFAPSDRDTVDTRAYFASAAMIIANSNRN